MTTTPVTQGNSTKMGAAPEGASTPFRGLDHPQSVAPRKDVPQMVPTASPARITVPQIRSRRCWDNSPNGRPCSRAAGHAGRHLFAWIHLDGRVREVWQ